MANKYQIREITPLEYEKWDKFVDSSPQGNIFNKSWWIQSVTADFRILVCEEGAEISGGIVLPCQYRYFYRNPTLTPTLGILFKDFSHLKRAKKVSKEMEISNQLIRRLPKFLVFDYSFSYYYQNWLPFRWTNFKVDILYSYVLGDLRNIESIYEGFNDNIKSDIKKAIKKGIKVVDNLSIREFYAINRKTFRRQSLEMPYGEDSLIKLDQVLSEKNARKILFAMDEQNRIHAAAYILYDQKSAYYLMGGGDPELRNSGATSLVIWEAIKFAATVSKKFDFEGSSIPNIEVFFRAFGGQPQAILRIYQGSYLTLLLINILKTQKNLLRKIGLLK